MSIPQFYAWRHSFTCVTSPNMCMPWQMAHEHKSLDQLSMRASMAVHEFEFASPSIKANENNENSSTDAFLHQLWKNIAFECCWCGCMYTYIYIHIYICINIYIYILYMYIYIYIYMLSYVSNTSVSLMSLTMPISRSRSERLFNSRIRFRSLRLFTLSTSHGITLRCDLLLRKYARKDLQRFRIQHKTYQIYL